MWLFNLIFVVVLWFVALPVALATPPPEDDVEIIAITHPELIHLPRRKRDLASPPPGPDPDRARVRPDPSPPPEGQADSRTDYVLYSLPDVFSAQGVVLNITAVTDLTSPRFVIQHVEGNFTWLDPEPAPGPSPQGCIYEGTVLGDSTSHTVLNLCKGMFGSLYMRNDTYFIEPLASSERGHVLYKYRNSSFQTHDGLEDEPLPIDRRRSKRSMEHALGVFSRDYYVEVMVAVDARMFSYHGSNVKDYVLTLMSIVLREHHDGKGHPGRISMISTIKNAYHSIPQVIAEKYIKKCQKCASRAPLPKPPTGKAIRGKGVMGRIQADLIDMSSVPDGDIKYILQVKDHCSKFVWAFGLARKACPPVAECIRQIFLMFAPCRILQMDNGGEFTGNAITSMLEAFPCVKVVHGRARHPQSQGLVERANQTLERRLGAWIQDNGSAGWSHALPELVVAINSSYCRVIKMTPFEFMFSRKAREPKGIEILDDDEDEEVVWVDEPEDADEGEVDEENSGEVQHREGHRGVHQEGVRQEVSMVPLGAPEAGVPPAGPVPPSGPDAGVPPADLVPLGVPDAGVPPAGPVLPSAPEAGAPPADLVPLGLPEAGLPPAGLGEVQHREGHRDVHQEGVRQEVQPGAVEDLGPCLLFELSPEVRAVAIGFSRNMASVHNHAVSSSELCIEVAEVLTEDPPLMSPFFEPMAPKNYIKWPKALLTHDLGNTVESVRIRVPAYVAYEKDRVKQDNHYQEQRKRIAFNTGDFVAMKIPRVDRANIDAVNMPARVLSNDKDYLTLQSPAGIINTKIHADSVSKWPASEGPQFDLIDKEVSLVQALRSTTAYGAEKGSVCNCKSGCGTKRCKCVLAGLDCSTKCHKGSQCVNKNTDNQ